MYRIIGADGQPYGPVDAAQVRRWFAENRVRRDTMMEREGSSEWKPLADFEEFSDLFQSAAPDPGPASSGTGGSRSMELEASIAVANSRPGFSATECLGRGWDLVMGRFWLSVGVSAVCVVITSVPLLYGPVMTGLFWFFLQQIRTRNARLEDAFEPFKHVLLQSFLAGLVVSVLVSIGTMLCFVPGIILTCLWMFTWPLLMDKRLDFWPAMEVSRKVLWLRIWSILGLWCLSLLLLLAGLLLCYVGLFVAVPVVIAAHACAYEELFGTPRTEPLP
ncbi:MAG TPA: GYF domain-containing protein [Verrucomicrobiae bacterium]|nr:GYF domain-containing protein [Verrucomicrobiae bacterium]